MNTEYIPTSPTSPPPPTEETGNNITANVSIPSSRASVSEVSSDGNPMSFNKSVSGVESVSEEVSEHASVCCVTDS